MSMTDFFFVSRNSLSTFRTSVTEGFTKLWEEMRKQKDDFVSRLTAVRMRLRSSVMSTGKMLFESTDVFSSKP